MHCCICSTRSSSIRDSCPLHSWSLIFSLISENWTHYPVCSWHLAHILVTIDEFWWLVQSVCSETVSRTLPHSWWEKEWEQTPSTATTKLRKMIRKCQLSRIKTTSRIYTACVLTFCIAMYLHLLVMWETYFLDDPCTLFIAIKEWNQKFTQAQRKAE